VILPSLCSEYLRHFEAVLHVTLASRPETAPQLSAAMRYACQNGGKRLRPLLVYLTGSSLGASLNALDPAALAVEFIHCYSLIHDDLPAMDDDDLRRGQPSCHIKFDEATAILAGDALQSWAFTLLSTPNPALTPATQLAEIHLLSLASGPEGMAAGQALDLSATGKTQSFSELETMHQLKTGALLTAAVQLGALVANADSETTAALTEFAEHLGLLFQIQDDILDVVASTEQLGKPQGSDSEANKSTYVRHFGLDGAKQQLQHHYQAALQALESLGSRSLNLRELTESLFHRQY
jgi:farnesyl diphosphate synthase